VGCDRQNTEHSHIVTNRARQEYYLLGYNAVKSVESRPTFRRKIYPPSSESKNKSSKIPAQKQVASRATTLKMEAICLSETSVDFLRITRRYIPEDNTPHNTAVRTSDSEQSSCQLFT
jgi:hypothetical protein